MSDVFLSYAEEDRTSAELLAAALEREGLSVWWDRRIAPGQPFDEVIEEALGSAGCVVVLWSSSSVESRWVRAEAEEAVGRGVLVPALLEPVRIPLAYRRLQAANLLGWNGGNTDGDFPQLVMAVRHTLEPDHVTPVEEVVEASPIAPSSRRQARARILLGLVAVATILFPVANVFAQVIPLRAWPEGGLSYFSPWLVSSVAAIACAFTALWTAMQGRAKPHQGPNSPPNTQLKLLAGSLAAVAVFVLIHQAIASEFYYDVLGWESDDLRRMVGDVALTTAYAMGFALLTRTLFSWAQISYPSRR